MEREEKPNPGSREAQLLGCRCPVTDNNHGLYPPWRSGWWIEEECPVHGDGRELAPA